MKYVSSLALLLMFATVGIPAFAVQQMQLPVFRDAKWLVVSATTDTDETLKAFRKEGKLFKLASNDLYGIVFGKKNRMQSLMQVCTMETQNIVATGSVRRIGELIGNHQLVYLTTPFQLQRLPKIFGILSTVEACKQLQTGVSGPDLSLLNIIFWSTRVSEWYIYGTPDQIRGLEQNSSFMTFAGMTGIKFYRFSGSSPATSIWEFKQKEKNP